MDVEAENKIRFPKGWALSSLGEVAQYINGRAFKPSEWEEKGKQIIRIQNLNNPEAKYNYSSKNHEDRYLIRKNDLLFAWSASLGAYIWHGEDAWLNQHIFHVISEKCIDKIYLYYLLKRITSELYAKTHGSGMVHVTKGKFEKTSIALPSLYEQNEIVSKIEEFFSELDSGIESLKKAREQLKTYRQAVLKHAFEGKLTEKWRQRQKETGNPPGPAEKLLERIRKEREAHYKKQVEIWEKKCEQAKAEGRKKPAKPKKPKDLPQLTEEELAELPQLPEGWCWGRFQNIVIDSQNGLAKRTGNRGTSYKVLRLADIKNGNINDQNPRRILLTDNEILKYTLSKNDFVCIRVNGSIDLVGRMILVPNNDNWAFCDHFIKFRLCQKNINIKYINWLFNIQIIRRFISLKMVSSAGQNTVSQKTILSVPIPFCSNIEQHQIVSEIESRLSVCDQLEQSIEDSLNKAETLRQSILKKAFSGQLTRQWRKENPELISGENSAEKLIERIREEKKKMQDAGSTRRGKKKSA
ncbi:MAG: restriction endonuclease subunit S [Desulfobacterales bacterium]